MTSVGSVSSRGRLRSLGFNLKIGMVPRKINNKTCGVLSVPLELKPKWGALQIKTHPLAGGGFTHRLGSIRVRGYVWNSHGESNTSGCLLDTQQNSEDMGLARNEACLGVRSPQNGLFPFKNSPSLFVW